MKISIACLGLFLVCETSNGRVPSLKNNGAVCGRSQECKSDCCSKSGSKHVCTQRQSGNVCDVENTGQVTGGGHDEEEDTNYYKGKGNGKGKGNHGVNFDRTTETVALVKGERRTLETRCGCPSCTTFVLDRVADGYRVEDRIDWVMNNKGQSEKAACDTVCGGEFPNVCGECSCDVEGGSGAKCNGCSWDDGKNCPDWWCNESRSNCNECTGSWFGDNPGGNQEQKCGGAVNSPSTPNETCEKFLWSPTKDDSMHCFAYGGSGDPCHLSNNNDPDDGIFKDPSLCVGDTFYLWDEPDTQGRDYWWAGTTWLKYSQRFSQQLNTMRLRGTKITGPLLKAGNSGEIKQRMQQFFDACGSACFNTANPAYIDVIAINGFCGPWNGDAGCYGGASFIYTEAVSVSNAFNNLPVYITNWSRLQTTAADDQIDAINSIDAFFPSSGSSVVKRVYWFGAKDFGGGSETSSYLTNILRDGRTLGQLWREKCDSMQHVTSKPTSPPPSANPTNKPTSPPSSARPTTKPTAPPSSPRPSSAPPSPTATLKPTFKPMTLMPTFKPTAPKSTATKSLRMVQLFSETNGLYITAYWPDGALRVDSVAYSHASTFEVHVVEGRSDQWQLRAVKNNKYVAAANGGGSFCTADRDIASGWETFTVTQLPNNKVQLKTFDGHYLGIDGTSTGPLIASATQARSWETFTVVEVPQRRGVNAGSWFVPEKWMFGTDSDLFAGVSSNVKDLYTLSKELGPVEISRRMKQHWSTWFTEADFANMASQGINHVRIPVGYWDIVETAPYAFGGAEYIDQAVKWAAAHGISVSIDLHGAPGSQNGEHHSGQEGAINWDKSPENVKLTVKVLGMISGRWGANPTVWGIEMLNEPHGSISHDLLTQFYRDGYAAIRKYSDTVHVVMNSLYGPHDWTALVLPEPQYRNVVLDLHLYTPWSGFTTEQQYMDAASNWAREIRSLTPFYPIVVGEMSLATRLPFYSPQQRQSFANISMTSFVENAYGFVFWSYKLGYDSPDWAFRNALYYVKDYYLPASVNNYCGCNSCTRPVWDTIVTDAGGSFSCGSRITWLQTAQGYSEASACQRVASEFPSVCLCDTMSCTMKNPTTSMPTTAKPVTNEPITSKPTFKPTTPKPTTKTYCGCSTCTETVWNTLATDGGGSYTCGARITWLQSLAGGSLSEYNACKKVAGFEFPNGPCGPFCDPSKC